MRKRIGFAWMLSIVMLAIYLGFVLPVAFVKGLLAIKIGGDVTPVGIELGLSVVVPAFVLTGIYVQHANRHFDSTIRSLTGLITP